MFPSFKKAFPGEMPMFLYNLTSFYNHKEKFFMAENLLKLYENASCVITDRLHCALPCLAFKTPVLLLNERIMKERFDGISQLLLESTFNEYEDNYNIFDVDNPPENSKEYLKIRETLINKCKKFTGHINDSCYSNISYNEFLEKTTLLVSRNAIETRQYFKNVLTMDKKTKESNKNIVSKHERTIKQQEEKIKKLEDELNRKNALLDEITSSNFWKITSQMRSMRKKL